MKKGNLIFFERLALFLCICSVIFSSCKEDDEPLYHSYGIINKLEGNRYTVTLDDGYLLYPQEAYLNTDRLKDSARMYLRFNILEEKDTGAAVRILFADTILTKAILPYDEAILDSVGNDPVKITHVWVAHGFLNFEFTFAASANSFEGNLHMVNLLQCLAEENKLVFEFRHNDFNDKRERLYLGAVCFPIEKLLENVEKPVTIGIKYRDSENTSSCRELIYK